MSKKPGKIDYFLCQNTLSNFMNENWKVKTHDSATVCRKFIDTNGEDVLFEVALADISGNPSINLDELASGAMHKHQGKIKRYRFTGSHFEPELSV